jgi:hypothetical protein
MRAADLENQKILWSRCLSADGIHSEEVVLNEFGDQKDHHPKSYMAKSQCDTPLVRIL